MKFKNIDFLRFLFITLIVLFHGTKMVEFPSWLEGIRHCNVCVDFFFIISGFFLFLNLKPNIDTWEFAKKRFWRLAPNIWLWVILVGILSIFIDGIHWNMDGNILRILLLHCVGFSPVTGGTNLVISWFVSALFWTSIFYVYISKIFEKKYLNLIIWLLVVFCYAIYVQYNTFETGSHTSNKYLILNLGICRALASMGLGYFISMAYKQGVLQKIKTKGILFINLCEIFITGFLGYYMIFSNKLPGKTSMGYIIPFAILFYFMLIKKGIISRFLDKDILANLGKYSYSIYCFHGIILTTFKTYIYKHYPTIPLTHPLFALCLQSVCAILFGIILYYLFEKPVAKYIKDKI